MKIVVLDGGTLSPADEFFAELKALGALTVYESTSREEFDAHVGDAEVVLTNKVAFSRSDFERHPSVRYIGVTATGYNIIDIIAAKEHSVIVTNIPAYSTQSVAQMVFAHILNVTNSVQHYAEGVNEGKWARAGKFYYADTNLMELSGKTIGIVGLGNIGQAVSRIARAFSMRVVAYTSRKELPDYIESLSLESLLKESDIISLHCPLTDGTRDLINRDTLSLVKPTAIIVNTARGPLVNEADMTEALNEGRVLAYCADVLYAEPPCETSPSPLIGTPRCYLTPHIAWLTNEAKSRLLGIALDNVTRFCRGTELANVVS